MKTTSFEISKKLADIGFIAQAANHYDLGRGKLLENVFDGDETGEILPAYDLETILDALPKEIELDRANDFKTGQLRIEYGGYYEKGIMYFSLDNDPLYKDAEELIGILFDKDENLADTAARLLILLVEKGIINLKE